MASVRAQREAPVAVGAQPGGRLAAEREAVVVRQGVPRAVAEPEGQLPAVSVPPSALAWVPVWLCHRRQGCQVAPAPEALEPVSALATMLLLQTCPPQEQWWRAERGVTLS